MTHKKTLIIAMLYAASLAATESAAFAQSTFAKSSSGIATQVKATQGQEAAATAQARCVELIKAQTSFEQSIAALTAKTKDLESKSRSVAQSVSTGRGSDKCRIQAEQADVYRETASEHLAYLDNIAESIKNCPSTMTEKLAGAQMAIKKSHEVLERVVIGTEGALLASCR
jgi:molecular chaperone GrpE (heat shock protein)